MNDRTKLTRMKPARGSGDDVVLRQLGKIKLLCVDVDGVMTDGGLYYGDDGRIQRKYNVKDGVGIKRAMQAGVEVAIISAGVSGSIPERAKTLGIRHVFTGVEDKLAVVTKLCGEMKIDFDAVAHIGDDLNDVPLMQSVGCSIAVADAEESAWSAALMITERKGGDGAVREICDLLVKARRPGGGA